MTKNNPINARWLCICTCKPQLLFSTSQNLSIQVKCNPIIELIVCYIFVQFIDLEQLIISR